MDEDLLLLVVVVLTLAASLNLFLTLRLAAIVRPEAWAPPLTIPIGQAVPPFEGRRRADGVRLGSGDLAGQAAVLAFVSPGCASCREKVAELLDILPAIRRAGVALWLVPADSAHDIGQLVDGTPLIDHVLVLDAAARRRLNPRRSAPFYLFLDDKAVTRASNFIGDEDWLSFVEQMRAAAAQEDAAA